MDDFSHLSIPVRTFGPCKNKNERTHTHKKRLGFTLLSQLGTGRHLLFNVLSDRKSSSQHSALFSTDVLISCSVFCLCSAGSGKDCVCFFLFAISGKRLSDLGQSFELLTVYDILCLYLFYVSSMSLELMAG